MRKFPNSLSFVVLWNQEQHESTSIFTSALHSFLQPFAHEHRAVINISDVSKKAVSGAYDGQMWQVFCTVMLGHSATASELCTLYGALARQWCTAGATAEFPSRQLQWLMPDRDQGFRRIWKPSEHEISPTSISFGTFANLSIFAASHVIENGWPMSGFHLKCVFKHDERMLQVYLILHHSCEITEVDVYQLLIPYRNVLRLVVDDGEEDVDATHFFLHLQLLPLLYGKRFKNTRRDIFSFQPPAHAFFNRSLELGCSCCMVLHSRDLGGNSVLKLSFQRRETAQQILERLSQRFRRSTHLLYSPMETCHVGPRLAEVKESLDAALVPRLSFPCCYAFDAVFQQGNDMAAQMVLLKKDVFRQFVRNLIQFAARNEGALEQTFFCIRAAIEDRHILNMHSAVPDLFEKFCLTYASPRVPPRSSLVRRVFVTPSRVFFLPPNVHCENRVLRNFDSEYALRVSFRDDHLQQLSYTFMFHPKKEDMMNEVVGKFLLHGVQIKDRLFKLLATSCSQLRDHGVWLYATDPKGNSADSIRRWMGDFTSISSVCQKMARMGQCFSSTEESIQVPLDGGVMEDIPDIVGEVNPTSGRPFVFSDGIGMISSSLMQKVCKKLERAEVPSAIQIRYAGYKGVLCVNPELEGDKLRMRESMHKFDCSTSDSLEVIRLSVPSPVFLNRPLITILEQLGVPSRVFVCLQQATVLMITDALVCERTALRMLCMYAQVALPLRRLQEGGFCLTRDPLICSLLHAVYKNLMDGLQTKSRIMVPENKGRNMLGVLDETNTLEYGQVFVQYTLLDSTTWQGRKEEEEGDYTPEVHVLTGTVLVTKCPSLHPGDVRKFSAVDVPALHHIRDCIVFPAKGPRPHPDEMAGSDLDGDEYIVIWDEDLLFPDGNREPMEPIHTTSTDVTNGNFVESMIKFVCKYITNDNVGVMSNTHLAWADMPEHGIDSPLCLGIAKKISICLDFAKTGKPSFLTPDERPPQYPDFMEKGAFKDTYRSRRVLGHLYRLNRSLEAVVSTNFRHCPAESRSNNVLFEYYPSWLDYEELAQEAQVAYRSRMERILHQHGIRSEGEVITGLINSLSDYNRSKDEKASVEVLVKKQYQDLVRTTREQFFADVDAACKNLNVSAEAAKRTVALQMASAWYMVTYTRDWKKTNCYSFPWSIADVLLLVMKEVITSQPEVAPTTRNVLITKLNAMLAEQLCENKSAEELALDVIFMWATKEELMRNTTIGGPSICSSCLFTLFKSFVSRSSAVAAAHGEPSRGEDIQHTSCDHFFEGQLATVGGYIVGFLRYASSAAVDSLAYTHCRRTHAVTMAALRTYSVLALSRDPCHVGLPCDPDLHEPMQDVCEGNPIRVKVSPSFRDLLVEDMNYVVGVLVDWSGVQDVNIRYTGKFMRNPHMIVSIVGRDWRRWYLEEILLQPWLEEAIISGDLDRFLQP